VMIANGALRELVLRPIMGRGAAEILSALFGVVIIIVMTRYLLRRISGRRLAELMRASAVLVLLTVAFEFVFGRFVDRKSWTELISNYAIWRGQLWPLVLATLALMPFLWGRWSLKEPRHAR
jgi:branched-subunit amino acid ABC-type transport system permease component